MLGTYCTELLSYLTLHSLHMCPKLIRWRTRPWPIFLMLTLELYLVSFLPHLFYLHWPLTYLPTINMIMQSKAQFYLEKLGNREATWALKLTPLQMQWLQVWEMSAIIIVTDLTVYLTLTHKCSPFALPPIAEPTHNSMTSRQSWPGPHCLPSTAPSHSVRFHKGTLIYVSLCLFNLEINSFRPDRDH